MQNREIAGNRGPQSIPGVLDRATEPPSKTADVAPAEMEKSESVFVFCDKPVTISRDKQIQPVTFTKVKVVEVQKILELARRNGVKMVVCPNGWKPGR